MRGQDQQAWTVHVDEGHHDEFVGGILTTIGGSGGTAFVAVVECGLVAVVTVGDNQFFVAHLSPHRIDQASAGDLPNAVHDAVFVGNFNRGSGTGSAADQGIDFTGVFIKHEELAEVGAGTAKQVQTIGRGLGQSSLVAIYNPGRIVLETANGGEAEAL